MRASDGTLDHPPMNAPPAEHPADSVEPTKDQPPGRPRSKAAGDVVANRYRLVEQLGRGGMGTVWLGRDLYLERDVAIKLMTEETTASADLRQRFRREAKAAAALNSKHVVEIYDHGVDDRTPYIVMERLEGEDLRSRLKRVGVMGLPEVTEIITQAGKALQRAQKAGIVHRDLKPANLFIAKVDNEEIVKVLDFGVAKHTRDSDDSHATKTGVVLGSPPYMSPEQARGRELDHRADLWSLGAIAYRALTGHIPFSGDSDGDIIVKICTEAPEPVSTYVPAFGPELDALFERVFARDPDQRFQSAHEMSAAFCRLGGMDGPPTIVATPVSADRETPGAVAVDGSTVVMAEGRGASESVSSDDHANTTPLAVDLPTTSPIRKIAPLLVLAGGVLALAVVSLTAAERSSRPATATPVVPIPVVTVEATVSPSIPPAREPTVNATTSTTMSGSPPPSASPRAFRPRPKAPPSPPKPTPNPDNPWGY